MVKIRGEESGFGNPEVSVARGHESCGVSNTAVFQITWRTVSKVTAARSPITSFGFNRPFKIIGSGLGFLLCSAKQPCVDSLIGRQRPLSFTHSFRGGQLKDT